MKPVLCAIDFSESSISVLKKALEFGELHNTSVIILYSYRLQSQGTPISEYRKNMEAKARQDFEGLIKKLKVKNSAKYELRVEIGFLTDRIEDFAKKNEAEIIIIGQDLAHSINDHKELSFQHFITSTKIPMLVVPRE